MKKRTLQTSNINFRATLQLKAKTEIALEKESKGLSEFLRDAMYKKVCEYEERYGEIPLE